MLLLSFEELTDVIVLLCVQIVHLRMLLRLRPIHTGFIRT